MEQYAFQKIQPESWQKLKAVRDSIGAIANLDSLYEDRTHANGLPYHVYVPEALSPGVSYPLVVFLHGHTDLALDTHSGFPKGVWSLPQVQDRHPHVLFVPRHRTDDDVWTDDGYRAMVMQALDDLVAGTNESDATPNIDPLRIYITGFSLGGKGTWNYIRRHPHKFAAAVPLSGYFRGPQSESEAREIKHIPIWIFNGDGDDGVEGSRASYRALEAAGAPDVTYHEFVGHGHVIDDFAYFTEGFVDWLFAQKKKSGG
jgi:predicted peptidase